MAGCGYVCPKCEGSGFDTDTLEVCDWCQEKSDKKNSITQEEWIKIVHESNCCSDIGALTNTNSDINFTS